MLKKIENFFLQGVRYTAVIFFCLSFLLYSFQTIIRIFFHSSILWIDPLTSYLFALSALYGSTLAIRKDQNIKIEIFKKINNLPMIVLIKESISWLATLLLGSIFLLHLREEFVLQETTFLNIKKWMLDIPYIFFLFAGLVFYLSKILNHKNHQQMEEEH